MKSLAARPDHLAAAEKVEHVVAVAAIRRAAPPRHEPRHPQTSEVVGDQALLAPDQRAQLTDPSIAVGELGEELPAQRVGRQAQELRWRLFAVSMQERDNTSIQFDGALKQSRGAAGRLERCGSQAGSSR
jgi:hypothetical protein